jgi:hypothetical protein
MSWLALAMGLWIGAAEADDGFALNAVLVPTFPASPGTPAAEAERLRGLIVEALVERQLVLTMDDVPPFPAYSATLYMSACPPGRSVGCALVCGKRASADWVLVGEVTRYDGGYLAKLAYLDVASGDLVLEAEAVFDGADDAAVARGAARALDAVIAGLYDAIDLRTDADGLGRRHIETDGLELLEQERELGEIERSEEAEVDRKYTEADVAKYEGSDVDAPWERVGMTSGQWLRYKNSGQSLREYQGRLRGRRGEIVIGTGVVVGQGPWTQVWEGWYGLDSADLTVVERATSLEQRRGLERTWAAEVGVGVLPWLQITAFGGTRIGDWQWRVQQLVEGDEDPIDDPERKVVPTWFGGGRVDFVPLPARPTFGVGAYGWWGTRQERVVAVPEVLPLLERQWIALLQLSPGFEVQVGKSLVVWGRFNLDLPVAGRVLQEDASQGPILAARPTPTRSDDGIGTAGALGLSVRLRVPERDRRKP